ncbi:MAG TPA: cupin domain-containing protein [Candidatus Dormibacteraeota bacterium]|nr:cupin domain-containing protein [Candidatus Dormibacteraeota bacterium]
MKTFDQIANLSPYKIWGDGVLARFINGERMTLAVVDLEPSSSVPEHHHENEQLGLVLRGSVTFTIGGEKRDLRAGDTYVIPSHVPHNVMVGAEGCSVVDVFAPVRQEWERLERADPFPGDWPG